MKKLSYEEGSVFTVPLDGGEFSPGVVARASPDGGVLFGYFFSPHFHHQGQVKLKSLSAKRTILSARFGDLALISGKWPLCGKIERWRREDWPMPSFIRRNLAGPAGYWVTTYADDNPSQCLNENYAAAPLILPNDGLSGYGSIEKKLKMTIEAKNFYLGN
jgi:hypothetical protein